ncbi:hypothetical protein ACJW31_05G154700 [Castanea mollissima]
MGKSLSSFRTSKLSELQELMHYKDAETIECATKWAILIDSLTPCRNILLGLATTFTCSVEAELLEIEIMSIDEIKKQKQSRKSTIMMAYRKWQIKFYCNSLICQ